MSGLLLADVGVRYGGVAALSNVSLNVPPGSVFGLIGPNGAGKTTLINATTGIVALASGSISLDGARIGGRRPHEIARLGIARTYQNIRLFSALSVRDNLRAGAYRRGEIADDDANALLARVGLPDVSLDALASGLSYGDQRRLEIARALASRPSIVMLDEPAAGMNPNETHALAGLMRGIAADGIAVLLIEHDVALVRSVCDRILVLNFGTVLAEGTSEAIVRDPAVIEAYLGAAG